MPRLQLAGLSTLLSRSCLSLFRGSSISDAVPTTLKGSGGVTVLYCAPECVLLSMNHPKRDVAVVIFILKHSWQSG